jgi:hypothetical protein
MSTSWVVRVESHAMPPPPRTAALQAINNVNSSACDDYTLLLFPFRIIP